MDTVSKICLFAQSLFSGLFGADAPDVFVTGELYSLNGAGEVPRGLFGTHNVPLSPERIESWGIEADRSIDQNPSGAPRKSKVPLLVECIFDRYQPALMLTDPNWEKRLERIARRYAREARELDREPMMEFWNEPYLNWAVKPGVNYDGGLYQGPPKAGEPMRTKIGGELIEDLVWDKTIPVAIRQFNPGKNTIDYLATRFMSKELESGDTFKWRDRPYRVEDRWWGKDVTQPESWWSGPVNREFYHRMFEVYASALKDENPDVTLIAGWGFHLNESNWQAWETLHKPLIDFGIQWIDGYNEHHYGGNTRMVAGTYETAYAYALGEHGKRLKFYNTEAGGMLDPERPGSFNSAVKGTAVERGRGAYTYMVRDILHLIDVSPDKAITRFAHNSHVTRGGDKSAFQLMRPLRGKLIATKNGSDPNIWSVASLNGVDYTVIVFNDHYQAKEVDIDIQTPRGYSLQSGTIARTINVEEKGVELIEERLTSNEGSNQHKQRLSIRGKDAVRYHFKLNKEAETPLAERKATQHVAPEILQKTRPGEPVFFQVELPEEALEADTARLRFVHQSNLRWRSKDLKLMINNQAVPLKVATDYTVELDVPLSLLQRSNNIAFHCAPEAKPILICTASLITEIHE